MESTLMPTSCVEGVPPDQCNDTQGSGLDWAYAAGGLVFAAVVVALVVLAVLRITRRQR